MDNIEQEPVSAEENRSLFEQLKELREKKKIKLDTIAVETRIHVRHLQALEEGRLEDIPRVYDQLFFQSYLNYLKPENEAELLAEFRALRREQQPRMTTSRVLKPVKLDPRLARLSKSLYFIIPLVFLIIIIIVLILNSKDISSSTTIPVKELPVEKIIEDMNYESAAGSPEQSGLIKMNEPPLSLVNVKIHATERTWIMAVEDWADTSDYMMQAGNTLSFQADSTIILKIGNPAGVHFTINGQDEGILGKPGEVISFLKINRSGIVSRKIVKPKKQKVAVNDTLNNN